MARQRDDAPAPWKRPNPKKKSGAKPKKLSKAKIGEARARARKAGRPYPNLVDNMAVARKRSSTRKKPHSAKKQRALKRSVKKKGASPRRIKKSG